MLYKGFRVISILMMLFILSMPFTAQPAHKDAPEIKDYMKKTKKERKEKAKEEQKKKKEDKNHRLRPYQTLDEVYAELDKLIAEHPDVMSGGTYGRSTDGRPLRYVKFSSGRGNRPEILYSGNIHAQEVAGGQICLAVIRYLAENYGKNCYAGYLVDNADIYAIPVLNVDNMKKATEEQARYGITGFVRKNEHKVDLNRNYPYPQDAPEKLKDSAGSPRERSGTYRGPYPLSEVESQALIKFIEAHKFVVSMNWHTSGGMIMYPPATFPPRTLDDALLTQMAEEYKSLQFDKYQVFPEIDLYPTIGSLDDYIYHRYGILCVTVEVGKNMAANAVAPYNGSLSPIFWAYNVYDLDREVANNLMSGLHMTEWAIKIYQHPDMIKWQAPKEKWVGEP